MQTIKANNFAFHAIFGCYLINNDAFFLTPVQREKKPDANVCILSSQGPDECKQNDNQQKRN